MSSFPMYLMNSFDSYLIVYGIKFGIYSQKRLEGKFSASLKKIEFIYREDLEIIADRYDLPIMFKAQDDYTKQHYVDTGMSLIKLKSRL